MEAGHIGKRSAAGMYCWHCDVTLCPGGNSGVHDSRYDGKWRTTCPKCGASPDDDPTKGCVPAATSSFRWAQDPAEVRAKCEAAIERPCVVDEYGETFTGGEFLRMLRANCAIEFTESIGQYFS